MISIYNISMSLLPEIVEFEWDESNQLKNWLNHEVTSIEAEEVFFDKNKKLYPDPIHSKKEVRKILIGKSKSGRLLFLVFTIRHNKIRVISVRDLNKRERGLYEKTA